MSDTTVNAEFRSFKRAPTVEYYVYFSMIFGIGAVLHVPGWVYQTIRHARLPRLSPLGRAWMDAKAVTPMIFRE